MKVEACTDDVPVQDFVKKKKKKKRKKEKENSIKQEHDESVAEPELGGNSPLLFEEEAAAAQEGEGRKKKKKKKSKNKADKHQASITDYCVKLEQNISNGTAAGAAQDKKRKRRSEESTEEHSDATCVPGNQHSPGECQDSPAGDWSLSQKSPKKKKKKRKKLLEVAEECEVPQVETHREENGERVKKKKKKKKRESRAQDVQEDMEGTAEQPLVSPPEQNEPGEDKRAAFPAKKRQDGDSDAASATSELLVEAPADSSTPNKAAARAKKTPSLAKKSKKSKTSAMEGSFSEPDVIIVTPEPSASKKKKKSRKSSSAEVSASELSLDEEEPDTVLSSSMDLEAVRQELEEFIPHVKNISDGSIKKMAGRDLARFKQFKKQGIAVKFGRFTQKENDQIRKNIGEFLSITGLDSAEKLLFTSRYPEDKETIHRLKVEHHFCEKISEGIPRPWRLIYYRARKIFDPNNYKGRYTKEEKAKLKMYHNLHGNDWKKISELMSRSNLSVATKFSEIKSAVNYGPWTNEETRKLKQAVKEVLRRRLERESAGSRPSLDQSDQDLWVDREQLCQQCQQLPWTEIETKVGSRFWRQCKQKWNSILAKKMSEGDQSHKRLKELQQKIVLIKRLHETKVEDANEVNWEELSNAIGGVPKSYVQSKFYRLKVSSVPLWQKKTFPEIIDFMVEYKLPELEEKLGKKEWRHLNTGNLSASQQKKAFLLSDIFDSSEDSD